MDKFRRAAEWWGEQLRHPTYRNTSLEEDRANPSWAMPSMMATILSPDVSEGKITSFIDALEAIFLEDTERWESGTYMSTVGVDYGPDTTLREAADKAGISTGSLGWPWKTCMWIDKDSVKVSLGYRGKIETIWERSQ